MKTLYQVPYSPYCLVNHRILQYSGAKFRLVNVPNGDRSLIWKVTKQRYYQVPVLQDGKKVLFETDGDSQVIAKYLDEELDLGLFPREWDGVQDLLWRHIENDVEGYTFKLNDIYAGSFVPRADWLRFLRHKERKFGRGCLEEWRSQQKSLVAGLTAALEPYERMASTRRWLLDENRPLFVDFDLYGMLANFLYSGNYKFPRSLPHLRQWYDRIHRIKLKIHVR